ncbi:YiiX/YebB-like N1pC/P60 family cysteine hydrolase [Pseudacidovorax intermedius]|uniref:YiiX/YebB-like N1pC/P60 family cysteine hydrolase n=1 Tax=Pseudacidovorax intermedius TaxID=433924 RepID=UPI0012DDCFC3|nr:YiiX/YebB-like N1pC/P60 family cysteine hydrolase [Pseudacidovorax intermedius]
MLSTSTKWIFDIKSLQPGDVLFTRSKVIGSGIAKLTGGRFGHVMLYLDNMIIHADTKGVWSKNPQRIIVNDKSRLAAFRLKKPLTKSEFNRLDDYARGRIGSLYSIPEAAGSLPILPKKATSRLVLDRQFCSRLVAQAFDQVGVSLAADRNFCTPNEIAKSELLEEVEGAVIQASMEDINFSKTPDYNYQLQKETFSWLDRVRHLADQHQVRQIDSQSDVGQWLLDHPHFDTEVCRYINETKYLSFTDADRLKAPWRYHPQLMLDASYASGSPEEFLETERRNSLMLYERVFKQRLLAIQNGKSGLEYFKLEEQLQTKRLSEMIMWKEAVSEALEALSRISRKS